MTGFDGISGAVAGRVMASMNADMERAALVMAEPTDGERFLVIGFGSGVGLVELLDTVTVSSVLAVDPSAAMVRQARRRLSGHPRGDAVQLLTVAAAALPGVAQFDAAIAVNCHQLWEPHLESVQAISKSLRAGGRLITLTHQWAITRHHGLERWKALVERDLHAAGFGPPEWSEATYRSGPALGMRALGVRAPAGMPRCRSMTTDT